MNNLARFPTRLVSIAALTLAHAADCTAGPQIPSTLAVDVNELHAMTVAAQGSQVYECRVADDDRAGWVFVEPDAELFDAFGRHVGHHGAGPHWQAVDGSRIDGRLLARADAPAASAIPWLLLETRSTGEPGVFERVTHVQRIHTVGGSAPVTPCTRDANGMVVHIAYRADYRLFAPRAHRAPVYALHH